MLFRQKNEYQVPLVQSISEALETLVDLLEDDPDDLVISAIHDLLYAAWATVWTPNETNHIPCITQRCLALLSIHQDGSLAHPKHVTPDMSRFEHMMRLTFLYQMHQLARTLYNDDLDSARKVVQRWFVEKVQSPFNTLRSLKHRA